MHLRHLKISSKNSAKIIQPISQWVLIESIFWLNEILAMHLIRKRVEINGKQMVTERMVTETKLFADIHVAWGD